VLILNMKIEINYYPYTQEVKKWDAMKALLSWGGGGGGCHCVKFENHCLNVPRALQRKIHKQ
jgi:hypothetical protein